MLLSLPSPLIYLSNISLVDTEITALQKSLSNEQVTHVSCFERPEVPLSARSCGVLESSRIQVLQWCCRMVSCHLMAVTTMRNLSPLKNLCGVYSFSAEKFIATCLTHTLMHMHLCWMTISIVFCWWRVKEM